jgi:protein arginine N-methyltransferase 5
MMQAYDDLEHFETPYVVKLHRVTPLAPTQPVFTFEHPNNAVQIDNTRSVDLVFPREGLPAGMCHGFGGFFEAHLYGDVTLSTHPPTHTPNMFSWFPIYFPLHTPVHCPAGEPLTVHMWRCATQHKVWYEWAMTTPQRTVIQNVNGRSYFVGL